LTLTAAAEVPNTAISRACYVLRFLLSDRADLRLAYYQSYGRVAVVGRRQTLSDVPEYRAIGVDTLPFPPDDATGQLHSTWHIHCVSKNVRYSFFCNLKKPGIEQGALVVRPCYCFTTLSRK